MRPTTPANQHNKKHPAKGVFLNLQVLGGNSETGGLRFGLNAACAGFDALTTHHSVLQIGLQPADAGAHTVRSFDCAGVGLTADIAHSGHTKSISYLVILPQFVKISKIELFYFSL
jgi:hypothetical protein